MKLYNEGTKYVGAWNFGPSDMEVKNVEWIASKICNLWGDNVQYKRDLITNLHEAAYLKLDCSKAINLLEWMPKWGIEKTLCNIVDWYKAYIAGDDIQKHSMQEINEYLS